MPGGHTFVRRPARTQPVYSNVTIQTLESCKQTVHNTSLRTTRNVSPYCGHTFAHACARNRCLRRVPIVCLHFQRVPAFVLVPHLSRIGLVTLKESPASTSASSSSSSYASSPTQVAIADKTKRTSTQLRCGHTHIASTDSPRQQVYCYTLDPTKSERRTAPSHQYTAIINIVNIIMHPAPYIINIVHQTSSCKAASPILYQHTSSSPSTPSPPSSSYTIYHKRKTPSSLSIINIIRHHTPSTYITIVRHRSQHTSYIVIVM